MASSEHPRAPAASDGLVTNPAAALWPRLRRIPRADRGQAFRSAWVRLPTAEWAGDVDEISRYGELVTADKGAEVIVVNHQAWALRPDQIAQLVRHAAPGSMIPDPAGLPPDPDRLARVTDPQFWAEQPQALAEALATSSSSAPTVTDQPSGQQRAAAASAVTHPGRLTLTVEEAAGLLGISRAFAYEAVRRGEIPSIRIGRRVLVPRVALDRLVSGSPAGTESKDG